MNSAGERPPRRRSSRHPGVNLVAPGRVPPAGRARVRSETAFPGQARFPTENRTMTDSQPRPPRSIADGGEPPVLGVSSLGEALLAAARPPHLGHLTYIADDGTESDQGYPELLHDALRMLTGIRERGPVPGDRILLRIDHDPSLLAAFWACVLGGFVPVPVAAGPARMSASELLSSVGDNVGRGAWVVIGDATPATERDGRLLGSVGEL